VLFSQIQKWFPASCFFIGVRLSTYEIELLHYIVGVGANGTKWGTVSGEVLLIDIYLFCSCEQAKIPNFFFCWN